MKPKPPMDEVDTAQQEEIDALKRRDIEHDNLFNRIYIFFFLTVLALFVAGFIALPFLNMKAPQVNITLDKELLGKLER